MQKTAFSLSPSPHRVPIAIVLRTVPYLQVYSPLMCFAFDFVCVHHILSADGVISHHDCIVQPNRGMQIKGHVN